MRDRDVRDDGDVEELRDDDSPLTEDEIRRHGPLDDRVGDGGEERR